MRKIIYLFFFSLSSICFATDITLNLPEITEDDEVLLVQNSIFDSPCSNVPLPITCTYNQYTLEMKIVYPIKLSIPVVNVGEQIKLTMTSANIDSFMFKSFVIAKKGFVVPVVFPEYFSTAGEYEYDVIVELSYRGQESLPTQSKLVNILVEKM